MIRYGLKNINGNYYVGPRSLGSARTSDVINNAKLFVDEVSAKSKINRQSDKETWTVIRIKITFTEITIGEESQTND
jgi:hypothetical protein